MEYYHGAMAWASGWCRPRGAQSLVPVILPDRENPEVGARTAMKMSTMSSTVWYMCIYVHDIYSVIYVYVHDIE